jgi:hypothetical protein
MMLWLQMNLGTIAVVLVLAAVVTLIVKKIVADKRAGRSSCGGNCSSCHGCQHCQSKA